MLYLAIGARVAVARQTNSTRARNVKRGIWCGSDILPLEKIFSEPCLKLSPGCANEVDAGMPPDIAQLSRAAHARGLGTGFFASESGHLITNAHVVDGCQTVRASRGGTLRMISTDEDQDFLDMLGKALKPTS